MSTELAVRDTNGSVAVEVRDVFSTVPRTFDGIMAFCKMLSDSELVPKDYRNKPANVMVAIQMGAELGISATQAIQNISVINGRPAVWGDLLKAIVVASPLCRLFDEDPPDVALRNGKGRCKVQRAGDAAPYEVTFSVDDAKRAHLWSKEGTWQASPGRMLQMRARAFACRDKFPDLLKGLHIAEEAIDITPTAIEVGPIIEQPQPSTQDEKGASVREKLLKQLKNEPAMPASAIAAPQPPPAETVAVSPSIDDNAWLDMKVMWEENYNDIFKQCKTEFQVPNTNALKPEHRVNFAKRISELLKGGK